MRREESSGEPTEVVLHSGARLDVPATQRNRVMAAQPQSPRRPPRPRNLATLAAKDAVVAIVISGIDAGSDLVSLRACS